MNTAQLICAVAIHADLPEATVVRVIEALDVLLPPAPPRHDMTPYERHRALDLHEGDHVHRVGMLTRGAHDHAFPCLPPPSA